MLDLDSKTKAALIHAVLEGEQLQDECDIHSFEDEGGCKHYQAVVASKWDSKVACLFSLPASTRNVYITVSDGDRTVVRRVLSTLEEMEQRSPVVLGNVALLDSPELRAADIVGVVLLPTRASNVLRHLPGEVALPAGTYRFLLVVFLTKSEHEVWKAQGHDALMDFFSQNNKDLVAFGNASDQEKPQAPPKLHRH